MKNITVLNVILAVVVAVWAGSLVSPAVYPNTAKFAVPAANKAEQSKEEPAAQGQVPSPQDYVLIADQNLFHPDRKIPVDKPPVQPLPTPDFVLYGTLVMETSSVAFMEDRKAPQNTAGRGKRQIALRKGDTLSGFTVKEIQAEKVVMARGEENISVQLNDASKPKTREAAAAAAPQAPGPGGPTAQPQQPVRTPPVAQQPAQQPVQQRPAQQRPERQAPEEAKKTFLDFFKRGR